MIRKVRLVCLILCLCLGAAVTVCAQELQTPGAAGEGVAVHYYVEASADTVLRLAPGKDQESMLENDELIPAGELLEVSIEVVTEDGVKWGCVSYDGFYGWIELSATVAATPQPTESSAETADQAAEETESAQNQTQAESAKDTGAWSTVAVVVIVIIAAAVVVFAYRRNHQNRAD